METGIMRYDIVVCRLNTIDLSAYLLFLIFHNLLVTHCQLSISSFLKTKTTHVLLRVCNGHINGKLNSAHRSDQVEKTNIFKDMI